MISQLAGEQVIRVILHRSRVYTRPVECQCTRAVRPIMTRHIPRKNKITCRVQYRLNQTSARRVSRFLLRGVVGRAALFPSKLIRVLSHAHLHLPRDQIPAKRLRTLEHNMSIPPLQNGDGPLLHFLYPIFLILLSRWLCRPDLRNLPSAALHHLPSPLHHHLCRRYPSHLG